MGEKLIENELTGKIVNAAVQVHKELGPGLYESVYETALAFELEQAGLEVQRQVPILINYKGIRFEEGFRADLIVNEKVIIELKSITIIGNIHKKQLLTYLRLADKRVGLLINFGEALVKDGITRIVNGLPEPPH